MCQFTVLQQFHTLLFRNVCNFLRHRNSPKPVTELPNVTPYCLSFIQLQPQLTNPAEKVFSHTVTLNFGISTVLKPKQIVPILELKLMKCQASVLPLVWCNLELGFIIPSCLISRKRLLSAVNLLSKASKYMSLELALRSIPLYLLQMQYLKALARFCQSRNSECV